MITSESGSMRVKELLETLKMNWCQGTSHSLNANLHFICVHLAKWPDLKWDKIHKVACKKCFDMLYLKAETLQSKHLEINLRSLILYLNMLILPGLGIEPHCRNWTWQTHRLLRRLLKYTVSWDRAYNWLVREATGTNAYFIITLKEINIFVLAKMLKLWSG